MTTSDEDDSSANNDDFNEALNKGKQTKIIK